MITSIACLPFMFILNGNADDLSCNVLSDGVDDDDDDDNNYQTSFLLKAFNKKLLICHITPKGVAKRSLHLESPKGVSIWSLQKESPNGDNCKDVKY